MKIKQCTVAGVFLLFTIGVIFSGCPKKKASDATPPSDMMPPEATGAESAGGETVTIQQKGSDTLLQVAQSLAEEYDKEHPNVEISVTGGGSGTGFQALIEGTTDIANASRRIKEDELTQAKENGVSPKPHTVGYDGISVIVHPDNPVGELSIEQISDIYAGEINNWKAIGGEDGEITILSRDTTSGTFEYFKDAVVQQGGEAPGRDYAARIIMLPSNTGIRDEVSKNETAIGYVGLGYLDDSVKAISIVTESGDIVAPSQQTVKDASYAIARPLFMYTDGEPEGELKNYLDWVMSEEGQEIVVSEDFVAAK